MSIAQLAARQSHNLKVVSSILTGRIFFAFYSLFKLMQRPSLDNNFNYLEKNNGTGSVHEDVCFS